MSQVSAATSTFNVNGNREHLMDAIYRVAQSDAVFTTTICSRVTAEAKYVEWQTDDLPVPNKDNAAIEGADAGTPVTQQTVRVGNRTQIFEKVAKVSTTQQSVKTAGRASEMQYQKSTQMKNIMLDVEAAAVSQNVAVVGDGSATASKMRGLESWLTTNPANDATAYGTGGSTNAGTGVVTDGTARALTKAFVDNALQVAFNAGASINTIMVGAGNKRNLSAALNSAGVNMRQSVAQKREIVDAVDVYQSDFGEIKIIPNRTQRNRTLFLLQDDKHALAWLQPIQSEELAKVGHSERALIFGEVTYVCKNEKANTKVADLT